MEHTHSPFEVAFLLWRSSMLSELTVSKSYTSLLINEKTDSLTTHQQEILQVIDNRQKELIFCLQQLTLYLDIQRKTVDYAAKRNHLATILSDANRNVARVAFDRQAQFMITDADVFVSCGEMMHVVIANLLYPLEHYPIRHEKGFPVINIRRTNQGTIHLEITIGRLTNIEVQEGFLPEGVHLGSCLDIAHHLAKYDNVFIKALYKEGETIFMLELPLWQEEDIS